MDTTTHEQGTEDWYKDRLGIPTASRYGDILAKRGGLARYASTSRKNYLAELLTERLTGQPYSRYGKTAYMDWGTQMEPAARLRYELETGNTVEERGLKKHLFLETGASADGIVEIDNWRGEGKGGIEIKNRTPAHHLEALTTGKVPSIYIPQIQGNMMCDKERLWWDWVSYAPDFSENAQIVIVRVYRDEDYIKNLEIEVALFIDELNAAEKKVREYNVKVL